MAESPAVEQVAARRAYFNLQIAAQRTRVRADELFAAAAGLTTAQAAALTLIAHDPGCTQRALATALRQRESAITAMVGRLVEAGLVERRVSESDRRSWQLWPTDAGQKALAGTGPAITQLNRRIAAALEGADLDTVLDALEALGQV
jgi:DNA-binding MarR family transcriptional regulator